jgi:hypothetical protein
MGTTELNRRQHSLLRNPIENRLRAGWRLLIQGSLYMAGNFLAQFLVGVVSGILLVMSGANVKDSQTMMAFVNQPTVRLLLALLSLAAILASCVFAARRLDKRPFRDYGFHFSRRWWADGLSGHIHLFWGFARQQPQRHPHQYFEPDGRRAVSGSGVHSDR